MGQLTFLFNDSADRVWVSGGGRLELYDGKGFHLIAMPDREQIGYVASITEDEHHDVCGVQFDQWTRDTALLRLHNLKVAERSSLRPG
jgi:hypothetical protein